MKRNIVKKIVFGCTMSMLLLSSPSIIWAADRVNLEIVDGYFENGKFYVSVDSITKALPTLVSGVKMDIGNVVDGTVTVTFEESGQDLGSKIVFEGVDEKKESFEKVTIRLKPDETEKFVQGTASFGMLLQADVPNENLMDLYDKVLANTDTTITENGISYLMTSDSSANEVIFSIFPEGADSDTGSKDTTTPVTEYKDITTVRITQEALNAAGYNCGTPDGIAGAKTTKAITDYQTANGITINGLVTDELLQSLGIVEKVQQAVKAEGTKNEYSADYSYDQLARKPDTYIGEKVRIKGKVLQADSSDDICYARVAMNSDYNTVIFVTYDKELLDYRLLEDDIVTVYGVSLGVYSYEAVSGATITIPWLNADIIEM